MATFIESTIKIIRQNERYYVNLSENLVLRSLEVINQSNLKVTFFLKRAQILNFIERGQTKRKNEAGLTLSV